MATHYSRGRSYEYKAKTELESEGYTVIRAAGSHGPYDLVAFKGNQPVRCIQIKRTKVDGGVRALFNKFKPTGGYSDTHYVEELWVWYNGGWHKSAADVSRREIKERSDADFAGGRNV